MSHSKTDHDVADPTMAIRSRRAISIVPAIIVSIAFIMVVPFAMQNMAIADFCSQIATVMAVGMILAGCWGMLELFWPDPVTGKRVDDRPNRTISAGLAAAFLAVVISLLAWLVATVGATSFFSYDLLKSGGLVTYIIGGLLPVIGYALVLYAVATRQIITNVKWRFIAIAGLAFSLMAPWFWAGYKLFADYHHM